MIRKKWLLVTLALAMLASVAIYFNDDTLVSELVVKLDKQDRLMRDWKDFARFTFPTSTAVGKELSLTVQQAESLEADKLDVTDDQGNTVSLLNPDGERYPSFRMTAAAGGNTGSDETVLDAPIEVELKVDASLHRIIVLNQRKDGGYEIRYVDDTSFIDTANPTFRENFFQMRQSSTTAESVVSFSTWHLGTFHLLQLDLADAQIKIARKELFSAQTAYLSQPGIAQLASCSHLCGDYPSPFTVAALCLEGEAGTRVDQCLCAMYSSSSHSHCMTVCEETDRCGGEAVLER